ncbi:intramembrane metalloprotease PrsW [Paenibacillus spiritus]|uniref:Protease PrsW n=1 Tax=Paenibacillus spiritus TaxID=2496557 RepID=A0A5J5GHJ7_9BACL|nr:MULTISPECIES: glutamic-type intramembrane protease PrsW [Paenibacillus]KAA9007188.1 intramembrane metalloprotease PrsW [Paenibacillus spiritus]
MLLFSVMMSAVAPGLALLTYFYLKDKYDQEPLQLVAKVFLLGFLIVFPVMIIQNGLMKGLPLDLYSESFLISAGVEEGLKWFVLYHMIYNHMEFDEPYDGIVYAVAISLGFATVENVLYALYNHAALGPMLVRALLPVSGHAMFGIIMGYHLGRAKFSPSGRTRRILALSFVLPWLWHGIYDFIIGATPNYWIWFMVPMMAVLWYGGMGKVARANNRSPFRLAKREEEVNL